jgi:hypothetical protein
MNMLVSRAHFAALAASFVLTACAGDLSAEPHEHDVAPLMVLDEHASSPAADDSLFGDDCKVSGLSLSYVDDASADRGRIRVALDSASDAGDLEIEVEGALPVRTRLDGSEVLSAARIQDAIGAAGDISISVHVHLDCGAEADNVFVFEDPIARCAAPTLDAVQGHEAELYECAERWVNHGQGCGASGYLLGYGARYARKFYFQTRPRMSTHGKDWLDHVLVCLQHDLREAIGVGSSCDEVRRTAFDQHPGCYVESGFCTLSIPDLIQVPATIDGKDLFSQDGVRQLFSIAPLCGREYARTLWWWRSSAAVTRE